MIGVGIDQNEICAVLDITAPTLRRHFRKELDTAYTLVVARLRSKLVAKADAGDTACLIFYCKVHGWSEKVVVAGELDLGFGQLCDVLDRRRLKPDGDGEGVVVPMKLRG